jgi:hypothetical protein
MEHGNESYSGVGLRLSLRKEPSLKRIIPMERK